MRLSRAFGARVSFTDDPDRASVDAALEAAAQELRAAGRAPYTIPRGGATPLGAAGYALAAEELAGQLAKEEVEAVTVVVANGSSGTQAGLVAGAAALALPWQVIGAATSRDPQESRRRVLELAAGCADLLGATGPEPEGVRVLDARGAGYARRSPAAREAAELAAGTEGLLLDHVFTAKAMATLIEVVRQGAEGPFVFIHTGGLPAVLDDPAPFGEEGIG